MTTILESKYVSTSGTFAKIVLFVAIAIGVSHTATWSSELNEPLRLIWRFASVGCLALYAGLNARNTDGWLLTAVMLISACSDILLVVVGRDFGAMCFIIADFIAIALYCRNFRPKLSAGSFIGAGLFVAAISAFSFILPTDRTEALTIAIFVVPLATMTALTFLTRFSPLFVGLGAVLILISDLLIFGRMGPINGLIGLTEAIWLCYFVGEALVVIGVTRGLMKATRHEIRSAD